MTCRWARTAGCLARTPVSTGSTCHPTRYFFILEFDMWFFLAFVIPSYISNLSELWAVGWEIDFCHWGDGGLWPRVIFLIFKMSLSSNCEHFPTTRIGGRRMIAFHKIQYGPGCNSDLWISLVCSVMMRDCPWVGLIVREAGLSLVISLFWDATDDSNNYHNKFDLRFQAVSFAKFSKNITENGEQQATQICELCTIQYSYICQ